MNLSEYIKLPREQRVAHIDLTTECDCIVASCSRKSFAPLGNYLRLVNDVKNRKKNGGIVVCHACDNGSTSLQNFCVNPLHLYFGTYSENEFDKSPELRSAVARVANLSLTLEQRRASGLKGWEGKTEEDKAELLAKSLGKLTPEQRRERSLKSAATRRARQAAAAST